jgi:hypothetical protein
MKARTVIAGATVAAIADTVAFMLLNEADTRRAVKMTYSN